MNDMNKKTVLKPILLLIILIAISIGCFFLFKALGITDINKLQTIISGTGKWAVIVFILIRVVLTIFLCFIPACSMIFDLLAVALFGANLKCFAICFTSVFLASIVMDAIGRFGGSKIIIKLVGKEDYNKAMNILRTKGLVYIPIAYLLPIFPDDSICMCSGALKTKWYVHYIEIILCRGIGCATVVLGLNILPQDLMSNLSPFNWSFISEHLFDYITMITVLLFWVLILLSSARKIDKILTNKLHNNNKK